MGTSKQATVREAVRLDGWINTLTGLGTSAKDKRTGGSFSKVKPLNESDCNDLYAGDDIAARLVDLLPTEATREWIELKLDEKQLPLVTTALDALDARAKFSEAWSWARCFGGSAIFMNVDDGQDIAKPLDVTKVRALNSLLVLDRYELTPGSEIDHDLLSPNFGMPLTYVLTGSGAEADGQQIHWTRLIRFDGVRLPRKLMVENQYWHDSIFTRVRDVLRDFNIGHGSVAAIIQDFRMAVWSIKNLADIVASDEGEKQIRTRIEIANLSRSVLGAVLLDADQEQFDYKACPVQGVADLLTKLERRLQVATDIPHTVLFGESPSGLGATGESEKRDWYDHVASRQQLVLSSKIDRLLKVLFSAKKGPTGGQIPLEWSWSFRPLWQPSNKELVETRKAQAETDQIYIQNGVVDPDEVRTSRFQGDEYSHETKVSEEAAALPAGDPNQDPNQDPAAAPAPTDPSGEASVDPSKKGIDPNFALNGAQVTAVIALLQAVADKQLPRESAVELLSVGFPISREEAERVVGKLGNGFEPEAAPDAAPAPEPTPAPQPAA